MFTCVYVCVCLTVDVVDGESVGEVGHVGLLSEGSFLLRGALRATIIQTLDEQTKRNSISVCVSYECKVFTRVALADCNL